MKKQRWPWLVYLGLVSVAVVAGLLHQDSGMQSKSRGATATTDSAAIERFTGFVLEYQAQGRAVSNAKTNDESELAQLQQSFAWRYAISAFNLLSPSEKEFAREIHQKLPVVYDPAFKQSLAILSEKTEDVWEKEYRESLEARGFKFP